MWYLLDFKTSIWLSTSATSWRQRKALPTLSREYMVARLLTCTSTYNCWGFVFHLLSRPSGYAKSLSIGPGTISSDKSYSWARQLRFPESSSICSQSCISYWDSAWLSPLFLNHLAMVRTNVISDTETKIRWHTYWLVLTDFLTICLKLSSVSGYRVSFLSNFY